MSAVRQFICWFASIDWTSDAVTAAGTIALAFLTLVLAVGTLFLWRITRRLVIGTEETAKAQLRAYVFVSGAHLENIGMGQTPYAQVTIKNFGQTPAYKMAQWTRIGIGRFPLEGEYLTSNESEPLPERPLPPQDEIRSQSPKYKKPINGEMLDELSKGILAIYVQGGITYRDAFNKDRCTRYLLFGGGSIGLSGDLAAYKDGNEANLVERRRPVGTILSMVRGNHPDKHGL
jgi:hypothetical protein